MLAHWKYLKYLLRHKWFVFLAGRMIESVEVSDVRTPFRRRELRPVMDQEAPERSARLRNRAEYERTMAVERARAAVKAAEQG